MTKDWRKPIQPSRDLPDDILAAMSNLEHDAIMFAEFGERKRPALRASRLALEAIVATHLSAEKPRVRVPYRREPEVQIVDCVGAKFTSRTPGGTPAWPRAVSVHRAG